MSSAPHADPLTKIWHYNGGTPRPSIPQGRVVLVGGCFDVFHYGHLIFLKAAKAQGDHLIVLLESDEAILSYKKRAPVHTADQRAALLASLVFVDEVVILPKLKGYEAYETLVKCFKPAVIAITAGDPQLENKQLQARSIGAEVVEVVGLINGLSSTRIRNSTQCR